MIKAILTKRPIGKITVSLREDAVNDMTVTVTKRADIEDVVQSASVHVYRWQGLPDFLDDLKALIDMGYWIAQQLDQYILTIEDFEKSWFVYQTGQFGQTWRITEMQPAPDPGPHP